MFSINKCNLCPRCCGVDRKIVKGVCGVFGEKIKVARASLHMWEEPCISGKNGSGTIFLSGCSLGCIYCQNAALSQKCIGKDITIAELSETMIRLQQMKAHNINFVTPTHYWLQLKQAVTIARENGLYIPIVYNTSGYERVQAIQELADTVSIYLADYKYADDLLSRQFSSVDNYAHIAFNALKEMREQVGKPKYDQNGLLQQGVIVRHLVLPGHLENSKKVLQKIYQTFGDDIIVSIMNQYTPIKKLPFKELNRVLSEKEYDEIINFALQIGIKNAYIQDGETQDLSFVPEFNGEGIL